MPRLMHAEAALEYAEARKSVAGHFDYYYIVAAVSIPTRVC